VKISCRAAADCTAAIASSSGKPFTIVTKPAGTVGCSRRQVRRCGAGSEARARRARRPERRPRIARDDAHTELV
jgi:hypothetical protein